MPALQNKWVPFLREAKETPGDATGRKAVAGVVWREASSVEDFLSKANLPCPWDPMYGLFTLH